MVSTVTRESDPELFWALRGGGGEFGIVLSMTIDLVEVGEIYGGRLMWSVEHTRAVLKAFAGIAATAPEELTLWAWMLNMPDLPFVPEPARGKWVVAVDVCFLGSTAEDLLKPLLAVADPVSDTLGPLRLDQLDSIAAEPVDPVPGILETRLLTRFDDEALDALLTVVRPGERSPLVAHEIRHLGGALARPSETGSAAGIVADPFLLLYGGIVAVPELAGPIAGANQAIRTAMAPYSSERVPANFTDDDRPGEVYPPDVLARLRELKQRRDPAGTIRGNRPFA